MKKIIFLFTVLFVAGLSNSQAQGTWTQKTSFGGTARQVAAGFSINGKGYIGTGQQYNSGTHYKDFWEYDPVTNAWTQKADFGGSARSNVSAFSINGKGYMGMGQQFTSQTSYKGFWEYNPVANVWSRKADFAGGARYNAAGFSIGNKGYIGTGIYKEGGTDHLLKDFWEYDPANDTWVQKADFGGSAREGELGFSIGNKGYIGTGNDGSSNLKDFWEYNPATNGWIQKADFGGGVRASAVGFSIGSKGYVGTGGSGLLGDIKKDLWEYDPTSNKWTQKADLGQALDQAVGFSIGARGYIGTGLISHSPFTPSKVFWEYTPDCYQNLTVYADADGDGYGNVNKSKINSSCDILTGYVLDSTDCNDTTASVHPGATETPGDKKDNNCNGQVDENNALRFDGVDDYVNIPNESKFDFTNALTVEAWIKVTSFTKSFQAIVTKGDDSWRLQRTMTTNSLDFGTTGLTNQDLQSTVDINDGAWHHVAGVYDGSMKYLYIDGEIAASAPATGIISNSNYNVAIGQNLQFTGRSWYGNIDEVRIWKVARTHAEIQSDMHSSGCGDAKGLVAYYSFNQGTAGGNNSNQVTLDDLTSNNNNGTLTNFALTGSKSNWVKGVPGLSDSLTLYRDADGDKYGNAAKPIRASVCKPPAGYVSDSTDCNDANASVHPGAVEVVNGIDDNCNGLKDEGNWKKETDFVMAGRISAIAFTYGSKVYFGLGKTASGEYMNDLWEYDPATNVWTQKVNFKGSKRFRATAFSIGPKGYVGTGCDHNGSLVKDFWEYNIATNNWRQRAYFGGTGRQYATGFSIGGKGYIGTGGDYLRQHNDFWEYNPATNAWTRKANAGNTTREAATGFAIGNKGYIGLGYNSSEGYKKDVWEYDPSTNSWKQKADFIGKPRSGAAGFVLYKRGYMGTGSDGVSLYRDFWEYNPAANTWRRVADFRGTKRAYAVGFSIGNRGYIGTGGDLSGNAYKDFWEYDNGVVLPGIAGITGTGPFAENANAGVNTIAGYKLWPNPVSDILYLDDLKTSATISILAPDSRVVDKKIISNGTNAWNIKALAAGSYYMKIEEETGITVLKFIKQ